MKKVFRSDYERGEVLYHLSGLLCEGYTFSEALIMYRDFSEGAQKDWLQRVYNDMAAGGLFAESLAHGGFSKELTGYLLFMEKYGDFKQGLKQASDILKKRYDMQQKVKKIFHYPILLSATLILMGSVMAEGVLPQFELFYESMDHNLPFITRLVLYISQWLRLPVIAAVAAASLTVYIWFRRKPVFEQVAIGLRIPVFGKYLQSLLTYYFASQLAPLLRNGFSLHDALKIIEEDAEVQFFKTDAAGLKQFLMRGETLADLVAGRPYYLPQLRSVVLLGETKGKLGEELDRFSAFLFRKMYAQTYKSMKLFQPLFLSVTALFIIVLFLSMMLPVFSILEAW